jgi:hypothetical protein
VQPVRVVPIVAGAAVRRPGVPEQAALPPVDRRMRTQSPIAEPAGPATTPHRADAALVGTAAAAPHPTPTENHRRVSQVDHEPAARTAGTTVTYPTGIVVQNEQGIYRPDRPLRIEEYLRFPEPQLDANGDETWTPLYHAKAGRR